MMKELNQFGRILQKTGEYVHLGLVVTSAGVVGGLLLTDPQASTEIPEPESHSRLYKIKANKQTIVFQGRTHKEVTSAISQAEKICNIRNVVFSGNSDKSAVIVCKRGEY